MTDVTLPSENDRVYYVYILYRDVECTLPFYVGKGKDKRWNRHEEHAKRDHGNRSLKTA